MNRLSASRIYSMFTFIQAIKDTLKLRISYYRSIALVPTSPHPFLEGDQSHIFYSLYCLLLI